VKNKYLILGAGITGLSAGISTNNEIYEANSIVGGICASYYVNTEGKKYYSRKDEETYRFEIGGGHWIFGADGSVLDFIIRLSPVRKYERNSAVYFPDRDLYVPYPLQNHLSYLPKDIAQRALDEIVQSNHTKAVSILIDCLEHIENTQKLLYFSKKLLKNDGLFVGSVPTQLYPKIFGHNFAAKVEHLVDSYSLMQLDKIFNNIDCRRLMYKYNTGYFSNIGCWLYYNKIKFSSNKYINLLKQLILYPFKYFDFYNNKEISCSLFAVYKK